MPFPLDKEVYQPITALTITDRQLTDWMEKQLATQAKLLETAKIVNTETISYTFS
jgi:hypothetical protein